METEATAEPAEDVLLADISVRLFHGSKAAGMDEWEKKG